MSPHRGHLTEIQTKVMNRPVRPAPTPAIVSYVTQRAGGRTTSDSLVLLPTRGSRGRGRYRLFHAGKEAHLDRDLRQVLWARVSFNLYVQRQQPTGEPEWKLTLPFRQWATMERMRCQICAASAVPLRGASSSPVPRTTGATRRRFSPTSPLCTQGMSQPPRLSSRTSGKTPSCSWSRAHPCTKFCARYTTWSTAEPRLWHSPRSLSSTGTRTSPFSLPRSSFAVWPDSASLP